MSVFLHDSTTYMGCDAKGMSEKLTPRKTSPMGKIEEVEGVLRRLGEGEIEEEG